MGEELAKFKGKNAYEKAEAWKKANQPKNWVVFDENAITIER